MGLRIVPVQVPDSLTAEVGADLRAAVEVERAATVATWGHEDLADTLEEAWAWTSEREYGHRERFVAVNDAGDVVGAALLALHSEDNDHLGEVWVATRPDRRRQGIGSALADRVEDEVRAAGRRTALTWTDHAVEPRGAGDADRVVPRSGSGSVPADACAAFALRRGYHLEQAERHSELAVPVPPDLLDGLEAAATPAAAGYRVVTWTDGAPRERLEDYALLHTRMSTDAPLAGLDIEEEVFDAARVRAYEREHRRSGHRLLVAAAEHERSGRLVAFTVLAVREEGRSAVFQDATLVLREHRGHRLGMLVKIANLRLLADIFPHARRVRTDNATENAHMLAINVALGFVPAGVQGLWQKELREAPTTEPGPQDRA